MSVFSPILTLVYIFRLFCIYFTLDFNFPLFPLSSLLFSLPVVLLLNFWLKSSFDTFPRGVGGLEKYVYPRSLALYFNLNLILSIGTDVSNTHSSLVRLHLGSRQN
jgi:hypothetical protein